MGKVVSLSSPGRPGIKASKMTDKSAQKIPNPTSSGYNNIHCLTLLKGIPPVTGAKALYNTYPKTMNRGENSRKYKVSVI